MAEVKSENGKVATQTLDAAEYSVLVARQGVRASTSSLPVSSQHVSLILFIQLHQQASRFVTDELEAVVG